MPDDQIDLGAVIEQLMTRIAQLEFEVAVLKATRLSSANLPLPPDLTSEDSEPFKEGQEESNAGYV